MLEEWNIGMMGYVSPLNLETRNTYCSQGVSRKSVLFSRREPQTNPKYEFLMFKTMLIKTPNMNFRSFEF